MRKVLFLFLATLIFFTVELVLFSIFGRWIKPDLILLLVIFFTLNWGARYGLIISVFGGLIKDSYSAGIFGGYIVSLIFCTYIAALINKYLHDSEPSYIRIFITVSLSFLNLFVNYFFTLMFSSKLESVSFSYIFLSIILPQLIATALVSLFIFKRLKICALRFSA